MKHLIFDFDGVLGNTWDAVAHGIVASGRETTIEAAHENMRQYFSKRPGHARNGHFTPEQMAAEYDWVVRFGTYVHEYGFELFDDFVHEIVTLVDTRIAIVSSGSQNYVLPAIEASKLQPTHILAYEDHHSKEEKIELVCKDWGIEIEEVYYFTDTLADVYELRDMLLPGKLIGVSWGYSGKEQLLTELPESDILNEPTDLAARLGV